MQCNLGALGLSRSQEVVQRVRESVKNGQKCQNRPTFSKKKKNPSLCAPICAGLPQFEEKIQRNKKVMTSGCQDNDISGAPCYVVKGKVKKYLDYLQILIKSATHDAESITTHSSHCDGI